MTQNDAAAVPAPEFLMSDKTCPRPIDSISALGREHRLGQVCGDLLMAPMPAGTPGDHAYYCERCGSDVQFHEVERAERQAASPVGR